MKKALYLLAILATLSLSQGCFAQYIPPKIEISSEKVRINGILFYQHKVEKRETLYSISKTYGVSSETIKEDNPSVASGLKEGEIIFIRVAKGAEEVTEVEKVQEREREIEAQEIEEEKVEQERVQEVEEIRGYHVVKWYETLNSIAKRYEVSEQDIAAINSLTSNKVSARQRLKIPYAGYYQASVTIGSESIEESIKESQEEKVIEVKELSVIRAKLLLPLSGDRGKDQLASSSNNFMEFYQGFLLALHDLKESSPSIKIDLEVIDTDSYSSANQIIATGKLEEAHIIFGPVYSEQLEPIANYMKGKKGYLVSPIDPTTGHLSIDNPNYFQVSTPISFQQRGVLSSVNFMSDVTLIYEESESGTESLVEATRDILNSGNIRYNQLSYNILKGRVILPQIEEKLNINGINHVVIASNSEAFVSDVLSNLNLLKARKNYKIVIYGTPIWRSFTSVDIAYYHQMNLNISMQYHVDYNRQNIKDYIAKYRAIYGAEPSPYAFQAYDLASYFFRNLWKDGLYFLENAHQYKEEMLQSDYNFIRQNRGDGFVNTAVRRVIYNPDFSTTDIRGFFR